MSAALCKTTLDGILRMVPQTLSIWDEMNYLVDNGMNTEAEAYMI